MNYFEPGSKHKLNMQVFNPTSHIGRHRFDVIFQGSLVDQIEFTIDPGVTKLLGTEITMPQVTEATEVKAEIHAYELSYSPPYDMGIIASASALVMVPPSGSEYNASAYFDGAPAASYQFYAGTIHKVTVKFTNPYGSAHEFYIVDDAGLNVFNAWGFFTVGAGQTVIKEVDLLMSDIPQVVGPVTFEIHCTTSGIGKVSVPAGSLTIIENPVEQAGTIQVVPKTTSVAQGAPFEYDVKITNTTSKVWTYPFKVNLYDKNGEFIGGVVTSIAVNPNSTGVFTWVTSMIRDWGVPPAGTATIKTEFLGQTQTQGTFTITAATIPAAKVAYASKTWFTGDNNGLMLRVNLKNNSGRTLTPGEFDSYLWSTHRTEGWVFESGLSPDNWDGDWAAGATKPFVADFWNMGFNPGVYDVILGLKTYEQGTWTLNGMSYPVSLGSYTVK